MLRCMLAPVLVLGGLWNSVAAWTGFVFMDWDALQPESCEERCWVGQRVLQAGV